MMVKKLIKRNKVKKELPSRITNDTVAEHREKILATGRKHKYPVQYTKHRLVWVTVAVSALVLLSFVVVTWLGLYVWKDSGDISYRITRILPLPVASIEGEKALYSDYLLYHRSTLAVLKNQGQADQKDKVAFYQKQSVDRALETAYAKKLARQYNISIDDGRVKKLIDEQRENSKLSESAYESVVRDNLGWSMSELHTAMKYTLLKQEVAFAIDTDAEKTVEAVKSRLASGKNLQEITKELGSKVETVTDLSVNKDNSDGGLTKAAASAVQGKVTGPIKTLAGDGYYFVTLQKAEGNVVTYSYLKVPLNMFNTQFNQLKDSDSVNRYISVEG